MSDKKSGISIALVASLCINAALIGAVGAGFYSLKNAGPASYEHKGRDHKGGHPGGGGPGAFEERLARSAVEKLDRKTQAEFRAGLAREWRETRDDRNKSFNTRKRLMELMAAETFDRAAAESLFAEVRTAESSMRERLQMRLLDLLEGLSAEERQALITESNARMERFEKFRSEFRGDGPPPPPPGGLDDMPPPPPPMDMEPED